MPQAPVLVNQRRSQITTYSSTARDRVHRHNDGSLRFQVYELERAPDAVHRDVITCYLHPHYRLEDNPKRADILRRDSIRHLITRATATSPAASVSWPDPARAHQRYHGVVLSNLRGRNSEYLSGTGTNEPCVDTHALPKISDRTRSYGVNSQQFPQLLSRCLIDHSAQAELLF